MYRDIDIFLFIYIYIHVPNKTNSNKNNPPKNEHQCKQTTLRASTPIVGHLLSVFTASLSRGSSCHKKVWSWWSCFAQYFYQQGPNERPCRCPKFKCELRTGNGQETDDPFAKISSWWDGCHNELGGSRMRSDAWRSMGIFWSRFSLEMRSASSVRQFINIAGNMGDIQVCRKRKP